MSFVDSLQDTEIEKRKSELRKEKKRKNQKKLMSYWILLRI